MIHFTTEKKTRTFKTRNEIQYIATAGIPQRRIANYCGPDIEILNDIQTSHITDTNTYIQIQMYYRNDVFEL